jgi:hypothetical protein
MANAATVQEKTDFRCMMTPFFDERAQWPRGCPRWPMAENDDDRWRR